MEATKQWEAEIIRRVCYIVNISDDISNVNFPFSFTEGMNYTDWYEQIKCNNWVISSYARFCSLCTGHNEDYNRRLHLLEEQKASKKAALMAALEEPCRILNQEINVANEQIQQVVLEAISQLSLDNPEIMTTSTKAKINRIKLDLEWRLKEKLHEEKYASYSRSLWKDYDHEFYDHASPEGLYGALYSDEKNAKIEEADILQLDSVLANEEITFEQFFYLVAMDQICHQKLDVTDKTLEQVVENINVEPAENTNGIPGRKWDTLQMLYVVYSSSQESHDYTYLMEKDALDLLEMEAITGGVLGESWLCQYQDLYLPATTEEEALLEKQYLETVKEHFYCFPEKGEMSSILQAIAALIYCKRCQDFLHETGEKVTTVASVLKSLNIFSSELKNAEFWVNYVAVMIKWGLSFEGLEEYCEDKSLLPKNHKSDNSFIGVGGRIIGWLKSIFE